MLLSQKVLSSIVDAFLLFSFHFRQILAAEQVLATTNSSFAVNDHSMEDYPLEVAELDEDNGDNDDDDDQFKIVDFPQFHYLFDVSPFERPRYLDNIRENLGIPEELTIEEFLELTEDIGLQEDNYEEELCEDSIEECDEEDEEVQSSSFRFRKHYKDYPIDNINQEQSEYFKPRFEKLFAGTWFGEHNFQSLFISGGGIKSLHQKIEAVLPKLYLQCYKAEYKGIEEDTPFKETVLDVNYNASNSGRSKSYNFEFLITLKKENSFPKQRNTKVGLSKKKFRASYVTMVKGFDYQFVGSSDTISGKYNITRAEMPVAMLHTIVSYNRKEGDIAMAFATASSPYNGGVPSNPIDDKILNKCTFKVNRLLMGDSFPEELKKIEIDSMETIPELFGSEWWNLVSR
ncbi:hypothetical protein WICPIJ_002433 [Wickerhamomyces pijperi]|uniref:Uncharacterized protein n=1 Tax=Wickerhamomyces pijperi TaxID=599730 RepID=A0A9P8QBV8_WICPI|nr:hypothetical protein WICPIJ_002433 [Wickerhamomyces pijperi]